MTTGKAVEPAFERLPLPGASRSDCRHCFTVLGEPPLKTLRYQQQFEFFNIAEVHASVRFVNLAKEALEGGFDAMLRRIAQDVGAASASLRPTAL
jgi:hypothetical protein